METTPARDARAAVTERLDMRRMNLRDEPSNGVGVSIERSKMKWCPVVLHRQAQ